MSLSSTDQEGVTINDGIAFVTILNNFVDLSGEQLCVRIHACLHVKTNHILCHFTSLIV